MKAWLQILIVALAVTVASIAGLRIDTLVLGCLVTFGISFSLSFLGLELLDLLWRGKP